MESADDNIRRFFPSTTVPVARAAAGLLVSVACLSGWVLLRWIQGIPPRVEITSKTGMYAYLLVGMALVVTWFGYVLGRVEEQLRRANLQLLDLATTDELTGLANARVFRTELPRLMSLAHRAGIPLSLVLLDLDHFKRLNDTYGHAAGNAALRALGRMLKAGQRREDLVARIGGEELALVLPGVDSAGARAAAERVTAAVRALRVPEFPVLRLTVSAGVAELVTPESDQTLYARADAALYAAKRAGRDRVEVAHTPSPNSKAPRAHV